jgi:uncharacterized protein (UPF0210 family)
MSISPEEILETIQMIEQESLDVRTVTMGISLLDCSHPDVKVAGERVIAKIERLAGRLSETAKGIELDYGIPIVNTRIAVTPISQVVAGGHRDDFIHIAKCLDEAASRVGVNFVGGFSSLVQKGFTAQDIALIDAIPEALSTTERVCSSVNVASTRAGINMDAVRKMGQVIKDAARLTANKDGLACAKLVVFANAVDDNPFMAGAFHGVGEPECVVNIGVSGPGVVRAAVKEAKGKDLGEIAEIIKKVGFKITRMGELVGREISRRLNVEFGILDVSLAPTPAVGDSVAEILEAMGLERVGAPGSTAALALLNDAMKKGGAFASSYVGGLSGAFIPVSEDQGMIRAAREGVLSIEKLEAMTSVCSVGLDMIAIPGDTPDETISAIIADEAAIGVINNKTTAVRIIPVPGKKVGDMVHFGGLLGEAPIIPVSRLSSKEFIDRGGRVPAPVQGIKN